MGTCSLRRVFGMCCVCALIVVISTLPSLAAEKIILIGSQDTKNSFHGRWLSLIYTEVFRRLGYELRYDGYPSVRASRLSDAGKVDGEINRVSIYQASHPNMIRVDESHFPTTLAAYAIKPGITIDGWNSLKNTGYMVEYRRGTKVVEIGLTKVVHPEKLSTITTTEQGLKRLILGRTDVYVDVEDIVTEKLKQLNPVHFDPVLVYQAGVLEEETLHVFLHKKNAPLVPKISAVLKVMKEEGLVEKYKRSALEQ